MTRQHQRGLRGMTEITRVVLNLRIFSFAGSRTVLFPIILFLSASVLFSSAAFCQDPDVEDVHVAPRIVPETPEKVIEDGLDSVRIHAPMIKSKVDLVLVPVT